MTKSWLLTLLLLANVPLLVFCQIDKTPSLIASKEFDPSTLMWYQTPASAWEEAIPVGNGRLGAMVYGKYGEETIQLNDDTYWTGGPYSSVVKGGYQKLPEIQKAIFEGEPLKAHKLFGRYLMGYPVEQQKYQSLANLVLNFENEKEVSAYRRWLDLKTGVTSVQYTTHGVTYEREVFASVPDQTIVIRIKADKPGSISFTAQLRGVRNASMSNYGTDYFQMDGIRNVGLRLTGKSADYLGIEGKIRYEARVKAVAEGGKLRVEEDQLMVEHADAVTLYFVNGTNFVNYKDVSADYHSKVEAYLKNIENKSFSNIKNEAIKDYQSLFDRVKIKLPSTENSFLPTDQRINKFSTESDPQLVSLCYQFGRYVLISSSRPGTQPANLQGIWNNDQNPPWDSKYTININTEMNYWPVETSNLSELTAPLTQMVKDLTDQGSQVAKEHYGARGWVCHQNTDLWRVVAPMDGSTWGTFTVGGAWLTTELWDHYQFTLDTNYLRDIYPVLKGSVEFFMDFLVEYPKNKNWLVTCPSTSPENPPKGPGYRYFYDEVTAMYYFTTICAGSSIDMQILKDLFGDYVAATKILNIDQDFSTKVEKARSRLVPPQIGADGMLQEWAEDFGQLEPKHRHISLLYGLYPGNVISVKNTPNLIEPVKKVLEERGDDGAGFSRAWKINIWARLYDGNRALQILKGYFGKQCFPQLFAKCFTPMQVDGTLGVTAGITEMLMQSHEGIIDILPALPDEWSEGKMEGVCARGAFVLNLEWAKGKITKLGVLSKKGGNCRLNMKAPVIVKCNGRRIKVKNNSGIVEFQTKMGSYYNVETI